MAQKLQYLGIFLAKITNVSIILLCVKNYWSASAQFGDGALVIFIQLLWLHIMCNAFYGIFLLFSWSLRYVLVSTITFEYNLSMRFKKQNCL